MGRENLRRYTKNISDGTQKQEKIIMNTCHTVQIPQSRYIGRIFAFFHIVRHHRSGNGIYFFVYALRFLLTGSSQQLGWYYNNFLLFKIENPSQIDTIIDIFHFGLYDLPIKTNNPIIVDIGGFLGDSAIYFTKKYPSSSVYIFEPNKIIFPLLQLNLSHNVKDMSRLHVFNTAVMKNPSKSQSIYYSKSLLANASLYPEHLATTDKIYTDKIQVISFNKILSNLHHIDLLKVDAEGSEYELMPCIYSNFQKIESFIIEVHFSNNTLDKIKNIYMLLNKLSKHYLIVMSQGGYQHNKYITINRLTINEFFSRKSNLYNSYIIYGMRT